MADEKKGVNLEGLKNIDVDELLNGFTEEQLMMLGWDSVEAANQVLASEEAMQYSEFFSNS